MILAWESRPYHCHQRMILMNSRFMSRVNLHWLVIDSLGGHIWNGSSKTCATQHAANLPSRSMASLVAWLEP